MLKEWVVEVNTELGIKEAIFWELLGASHLDLEELLSPVSQEWEGRKSTQ